MKYKFIFVILSSSNLPIQNVYYNSNDKYEKFKQLQKMYLHLYPNDIKFFFIEYLENLEENICEQDDFIYVKGSEMPMVPNTLLKTLSAVKYIHTKYDYDYIIHTNLSSLWNIPLLLTLHDKIPRNNFFGGHVISNTFVSGTGIFISRDLTPLLLEANRNDSDNNDVVISRRMKHSNITTYMLNNLSQFKMNHQILDETVTDKASPHHVDRNPMPEIIDDILYFRIRNATIEQDLYIMKLLIHKLYQL
jgi:hypothetical protein